MRFPRAQEIEHEKFDLTAMIDIVLLLIIFFTLTAQFAAVTRSPMRLPAESGRPDPPAKMSVVVDVASTGVFSVLGRPVDTAGLTRLVKSDLAQVKSPGDFDLIIRADRDTPSVHVNRLANAIAKSGVRTWKLATTGESAAPTTGDGAP